MFDIPLKKNSRSWQDFIVRQIQQERYYATRCEYGRLHTSFTALKKSIRNRLRYRSQQLCDVDISNCQPLLIGIQAEQQQEDKQGNTICGASIRERRCEVPADLAEYIKHCESGTIYEWLLKNCREKYTLFDCIPIQRRHTFAKNRTLLRSDIKKQFLVMLFNDVTEMRQMPIFQLFQSSFPTVAAFVEDQKSSNYQELARNCQRFESRIMIDGVCGSVFRTSPETPILTIHDGVIVPENRLDQLKFAIKEKFAAHGVSPSLKIGPLLTD